MKLAKLVLTIFLLTFVAATVVTLIAQEVARPKVQVAEANESILPVEPSVPVSSEPVTSEQEPVLNKPAVVSETELPKGDGLNEVSVAEETNESLAVAPFVIEAIYFHNAYRCVTCTKIESVAKAIVEAEFADQLAAGTLRWSAINMEEERAYISLYDLAMPSLVLIRKVGDEVVDWVTLHETWSNIRSSTRFSEYIIDSFQAFMEESL